MLKNMTDRTKLDVLTCFLPSSDTGYELTGTLAEHEKDIVANALSRCGFSGKDGQSFMLPVEEGRFKWLHLVGLGDHESITVAKLVRVLDGWITGILNNGMSRVGVFLDPVVRRIAPDNQLEVILRCLNMATYRFRDFTGDEQDSSTSISIYPVRPLSRSSKEFSKTLSFINLIRKGEILARNLCNTPANRLSPTTFAEVVMDVAGKHDYKVELWNHQRLEKERMSGMMAVGQSSIHKPCMLHLSLNPEHGKRIAVIGKGVIFDSGGLALKPASGMETMKYDKCGAGIVAGLVPILPALNLTVGVDIFLPLVENMPSGGSVHPGDILTFRDGKTVEVVNPDAEGRLIVADCLILTRERGVSRCVDVATLTGACKVALGSHAAGLMGNDEAWINQVESVSQRTGQWVWPLPLWEEYQTDIKGRHSQLKNTGGKWAGAITAGWFLRRFIDPIPWCHLDVAGVAYHNHLTGSPPGATGWGVHLLAELIQELETQPGK